METIHLFRRALIAFIFLLSAISLYAQPTGFSYQGVARDADGDPITGRTLTVHFSILAESGELIWKEEHDVTPNDLGMFSSLICNSAEDRTGGSASTPEDIDWSAGNYSLRVELDAGSGLTDMGIQALMAVPYALAAGSASGIQGSWEKQGDQLVYLDGNVGVGTLTPAGTLTVTANEENVDAPLFMVTKKNGYPVFAVYENGVHVYTDTVDDGTKGKKGGFAVGGYNPAKKGFQEEYMLVTSDSIRFYVNEDRTGKGLKGGFAVGGYNSAKAITGNEFLRVTSDSVRIYIDDSPSAKGLKGGFAVGGYNSAKGNVPEYFSISGRNTADVIKVSESRILWYPKKEAFLAGRVLVSSPDSVGTNSFSTGFESKAKGNWSQAFGFRSVAAGDYSTAIGRSARASGPSSFAFGGEAKAMNEETFAFGRDAQATGFGSFAMGDNAIASGNNSYAIGTGTRASGLGSFALGFVGRDSSDVTTGSTAASANWAVAIGMGATASSRGAFSIGTMTLSNGPFSYAIGYRTISSGWYSLATGYTSSATGNFSTAMGYASSAAGDHSLAIGQGALASDWYAMALGLKSHAEGQQSLSLGSETLAQGNFSMAIGKMSKALKVGAISIGFNSEAHTNALAVGYEAVASGNYSMSLGFRSSSTGEYAFSAGNSSTASGPNAMAMGSFSVASGASSFAAGQNALSEGAGSVSIGFLSRATGDYSFATGYDTEASGTWSFVGGQYTRATAWNTFAMGGGSRASGYVAAAFGLGTIAKPFASFVVGQYNDSACSPSGPTTWVDSDPLFIIGNGSSDGARNNAMVVTKNGGVAFPDITDDFVTDGTLALYIDSNGKIGPMSSSSRYKQNISSMEDIGWLFDLEPVNFTYVSDKSGKKQYGLIAEDAAMVNTDLVRLNRSGIIESVEYNMLITPMLKALQDQQSQIELQRELIRQKEEEIDALKERMDLIEQRLGGE